MHIDGVILPGDIDRGGRALLGLTLVFTPAGIEVRTPQPDSDTLVAWSGLLSARCSERTVLPDMQGAAVLECVSESQTIRSAAQHSRPRSGRLSRAGRPAWLALYRDGAPRDRLPGRLLRRRRTDAPGAAAGSLDEAAWTVGVLSTGPAPNGPSSSSGMTPRQPPTPLPSPPPAPPDEWIPIGEPGPAWVLSPVPAPAFRPDRRQPGPIRRHRALVAVGDRAGPTAATPRRQQPLGRAVHLRRPAVCGLRQRKLRGRAAGAPPTTVDGPTRGVARGGCRSPSSGWSSPGASPF